MREAAAEKPILIQVSRPPDETNNTYRYGWYVLEQSSSNNNNGPKLTEIFPNLPGGVRPTFGSKSVLVGSFLYLVTGRWCEEKLSEIFCFDTQNPSEGWTKCTDLPFRFAAGTLHVLGNSIYILPFPTPFEACGEAIGKIWGYEYDTIEHIGKPIDPPFPQLSGCGCNVWSYFEDGQVLVAPYLIEEYPSKIMRNRLCYDFKNKAWSMTNDDEGNCKSLRNLVETPNTVSNGVLYWLNLRGIPGVGLLNAYHLRDGFSQTIRVPELSFAEGMRRIFLVPFGDSKIGFVWVEHYDPYSKGAVFGKADLHYATVKVSFDHNRYAKATLVERNCFKYFGCLDVYHCLRFDSFRGQNEGGTGLGEEPLPGLRTKLWEIGQPREPIQQRPQLATTNLLRSNSLCPSPFSSFATSWSTLTPSVYSDRYKSSMPLIPSASLSEFKGYLARGTSLLKKCIKK